jgi:hypothetical protein
VGIQVQHPTEPLHERDRAALGLMDAVVAPHLPQEREDGPREDAVDHQHRGIMSDAVAHAEGQRDPLPDRDGGET